MCVRKILCYNYSHMGEATRDLIWVVGIFIAVGLLWLFTGGPARPTAKEKPFLDLPSPASSQSNYYNSYYQNSSSSYSGWSSGSSGSATQTKKVRLSSGSAFYSIYPNQEYVEITADYNNSAPINISGWSLSNKPAPENRFKRVVIPLGNKLLVGSVNQVPRDPIILRPGERAIIVTGKMPASVPYPVSSFLVNKCSGYLEDLPNYQFTPSLWSSCPVPGKEVDINSLDENCYSYVRSLSSCHTPEITTDQNSNELVDGRTGLSTTCRLFVKAQFSYSRCLERHQNDSDFYDKEWRVYLNQTDDLWYQNRDAIKLYDSQGLLVDQIEYQ